MYDAAYRADPSAPTEGETLILDLTAMARPRPRRRRRSFEPPLDGWTANASPLEHNLMVTSGCADARCRAAAWAEHLRRCPNCAHEQERADRERGAPA